MALLADGDQPAYAWLKERATTALELGQEQPEVDFKRGEPWKSLWLTITETVLAMSNLRDGGLIIVGRAHDGSPDGVSDADLLTYDPDVMRDAFDKYASPRADVSIVMITHQSNVFVVIETREFAEEPVVCRSNHNKDLLCGALYVRPLTGRPRTTMVTSAEEMRSILDLAVEKKMRRFNAMATASGFVPQATNDAAYRQQLAELDNA